MEGNNAALMSKIIASLWPKPQKGESEIINDFNIMSNIDWTKKQIKKSQKLHIKS